MAMILLLNEGGVFTTNPAAANPAWVCNHYRYSVNSGYYFGIQRPILSFNVIFIKMIAWVTKLFTIRNKGTLWRKATQSWLIGTFISL